MSKTRLRCLVPTLVESYSPSGWKPDEIRGNRHERGYGSAWDKQRLRIRDRDAGLCQPHLRQGRICLGTECDHIVPKAAARALGWTDAQIDADENLQWICVEAHREKTSRESADPGGVLK